MTWANIATIIVAVVGGALVSYVMTRARPAGSREAQLERVVKDAQKRIRELENTVDGMQRLLSEAQQRIESLEIEVNNERRAREHAEWQLTYLQALQGTNVRLPKPPETK